MRELEFRAYITPLKRYATGLDVIQFHKCCDVAGVGIWTVVTVNEGIFEFDDIVIEQDTGLKDKNGKEIHEGDIIQEEIDLNSKMTDGIFKYRVYWDEEELCWGVEHIGKESIHTELWQCDSSREVVGNIHENHELLGGDE